MHKCPYALIIMFNDLFFSGKLVHNQEKTVLVTGAAGFIGFHLALNLHKQGHIVIALDNFNDYYDVRLKIVSLFFTVSSLYIILGWWNLTSFQ